MKRRNFIGGLAALIGLCATPQLNAYPISDEDIDDLFYDFFYKFNGFKISEMQKQFYDWYKKGYKIMSVGRQVGQTAFLLTLAAFLSLKGQNIIYATFNKNFKKHIESEFNKKQIVKDNNIKVDFITPHIDNVSGKNFDYILMDNCIYAERDLFYYVRVATHKHGKSSIRLQPFEIAISSFYPSFSLNTIEV